MFAIAIAGRTGRWNGCPGSNGPSIEQPGGPEGFQSRVGGCYSGGNGSHPMTIVSAAVDRPAAAPAHGAIRHDWSRPEIRALFELPFPELMFRAQSLHRSYFDPTEVQISTLLSIKTGGCPEDCAYCPQSAHYETGVKAEKLMSPDAVLTEARAARAAGASRFCMGAAWREPKERDLDKVCAMVEGVRALGLETCVTLGMLTAEQTARLKTAGLDYYNHN